MININRRVIVFFLFLTKYWNTFGLFAGTSLFVKFKFKKFNNIKLPSLKHPFKLRNTYADTETFNQIFIEGSYDIDFEHPKIIIDGGANIGLFAVQMTNRYPNAKIICIEPDKENFGLLKQNVSLYENIFCENIGLWNINTKLKVYDKHNLGKWGIIVEENIEEGTIPAMSLDFLMKKYNIAEIDILKLDIETSEKQLFSNNYQNWLLNVKSLVVEFHDRMEGGCFKNFIDAINEIFSNYDYSVCGENTIICNMIRKK